MSLELRQEIRQREHELETQKNNHRRLGLDLRLVARSPEGLRLLRWLLRQGNIFSNDYQPGIPGAYAAGRKAAALDIWSLLRQHLPQETCMGLILDNVGEEEAGLPGGNDPSIS